MPHDEAGRGILGSDTRGEDRVPGCVHVIDRHIGEPLGEIDLHVHDTLIAREDADVDVLAGARATHAHAVISTKFGAAEDDDAIPVAAEAEGRAAVAAIQEAFADRRDASVGIGTQQIDARETGLGQPSSIGDGRCDVEIAPLNGAIRETEESVLVVDDGLLAVEIERPPDQLGGRTGRVAGRPIAAAEHARADLERAVHEKADAVVTDQAGGAGPVMIRQ